MGNRNNKKNFYWVSALIPVLSVVLLSVFAAKLFKMHVLPTKYLVAGLVVLAVFDIFHVVAILKKWKICNWIFSVISVIVSVALVVGIIAVTKVSSTLEVITNDDDIESVMVDVVSLKSSNIDSFAALEGKNVGLCDDDAGKKLALEINGETQTKPVYVSYSHPMFLVDALINKEIDAMIIDEAFLEVVSDYEEYAGFGDSIIILCSREIKDDGEKPVFSFDKEAKEEVPDVSENDTTDVSENDVAENSEGDGNATKDNGSSASSDKKTTTTVNTGGVPNSKTGAHTTSLDWSNDIITSKEGTFIAYISGIDTLGSVDVKKRSDVNILAAVNTNTGTIQLIDTPRDYFVILPKVNQADKLTHAGIYGIDYSIGALERLYGIKVDYYLRMNFTGFVKIIDTIGGIDVYSDYEFTVDPVKTYTVGENHLNGIESLAFARERYSFSSGDIQRGQNQMKVIRALVNKLSSPEIIVRYNEILGCVSDSFQTNMPSDVMYSLISHQITTGTAWNTSSFVSGGYGASSTTYSGPTKVGYVMTPNDDDVAAAHNLFKSVLGY